MSVELSSSDILRLFDRDTIGSVRQRVGEADNALLDEWEMGRIDRQFARLNFDGRGTSPRQALLALFLEAAEQGSFYSHQGDICMRVKIVAYE